MLSSKDSHSDLQLTSDNYYDNITDWKWQSFSWFKKFLSCEAEALAELKGDYQPEIDKKGKTALLVGNYVHSYFESPEAHAKFLQEHSEILAKTGANKGKPKREYVAADNAIHCLEIDPSFNKLYQGDKEVIVQGKIFGVDWKGKIDCLDLEHNRFLDLKTTIALHKEYWNKERRIKESFIEHYKYHYQMWIYQQLIEQTFGVKCQPYIIAVTKENVPDKAIISIPTYRLEEAKNGIKVLQDHVQRAKDGEVRPKFCDVCDYCKSNKLLGRIYTMDELI